MINLLNIEDADLKDKIVLVRVDHNVVKKGEIFDPYRIDATLGTLYYINAKGGKIILMSHVGRPKDKSNGEIDISKDSSILPIVQYLQKKLHITVAVPKFEQSDKNGIRHLDTSINHDIRDLRSGKIDMIYLPNTRWFSGEEGSDVEKDKFAYQLAGLADLFVNDAFGSWRAHASTYNITRYLPSFAGFLLQKEIANLDRVFSPKKPFVAVIAGAKFDTKIEPLFSILKYADFLVLGGVIYNAYLSAKYDVKIKGVSEKDREVAKKFIDFAQENYPEKIIELPFVIESKSFEKKEGNYQTISIDSLAERKQIDYILDVDKSSFQNEKVKQIFLSAHTIFVNAVMGFVPHFTQGTIALDSLIDENKEATKLYGGGDTMQELKRLLPGLYIVAIDHPKYYIFTGGGAVLKAIESQSPLGLLPIKILNKKYTAEEK